MSDTATITDLEARAAVTAGLRALAEFLDAHPGLPVLQYSISAGLTFYPVGGQEDKRAEVDRIADVLQVTAEDFGVYQAERRFGGPVAYRAVVVPEPEDIAEEPRTMTTPLLILLAAVSVIGAGVLALLVLLLIGIRAEERHMSLTSGPRTCTASLARRLTGAAVRRPQQTPHCRHEDTRK
jgi:hypothetical protein